MSTRRQFLVAAGLSAAAGPAWLSQSAAQKAGATGQDVVDDQHPSWQFGMASYSLRAFPLDEALAMTRRLGLSRITLKDMHLPLTATAAETAMAVDKVRKAGLSLTACGVVYMKSAEEVRRAFDFAGRAGVPMIIGAPDRTLLDSVERAVQATGIALAIHNHGPSDAQYPSPESAYTLIARRDRRLGLCIDVGHTQRLGLDPAVQVERFFDRLLDVHIKDVSAATAQGDTIEAGRGVIDLPALLRMVNRLGYKGTLHLEFEKDEKDPLPGIAESLGYLRGVQAALNAKKG